MRQIPEPKMFTLYREFDSSGVSSTGRVLDGIVFHNGLVAVCWRTDVDAAAHGDTSIGVYMSFDAFFRVHVLSHPKNNSRIVWKKVTNGYPKDK